jgi:hypothetical protein
MTKRYIQKREDKRPEPEFTKDQFRSIWNDMAAKPEPTEEEARAWLLGAMGKLK